MNLTISVDDGTLQKARTLASKRGISLQDLLRQYLESLVGERPASDVADQLLDLMRSAGGHSGGRRIRRDEAYEDRI